MINSAKLFFTRIYLTIMATTPMITLTQDECKVLLDAYSKYGVREVRLCLALDSLKSAQETTVHSIKWEIMVMLRSRAKRGLDGAAEDLNMHPVHYRVKWINQVMAYNGHPNKLHILKSGKIV